MAAHRYWRAVMVSPAGGIVRVSELQMRIVAAGANVATGGSAFAFGTDGGSSANNAFDATSGTHWSHSVASGRQTFLGYDFGSGNDKAIVEVAAEFNSAIGSTDNIPISLRVEFSDDNVLWTAVSPGYAQVATFGTYTYGPLVALGTLRVAGVPTRLAPGWPNPTALVKRVSGAVLRNRTQDSGQYKISGTIKVDGSPDTPVARKVVLFDQVSLRVLQSTFSDGTTGAYEFTNLANKPHMVMSFDHEESFRAVVADRVTPEPM